MTVRDHVIHRDQLRPPQGVDEREAQARLARYVAEGKAKADGIVERLAAEAESRIDRMVGRDRMTFAVGPDDIRLGVEDPIFPEPLNMTTWAQEQAWDTLGVTSKFVQRFQREGERGLKEGSVILNRLKYRIGGEGPHAKPQRFLRVVEGNVRGWLSPSYRIMDQTEIMQGFALALREADKAGVVITDGALTERRYSLTAIWPHVLQPYVGEYVVLGLTLTSGDYGGIAVDMLQTVTRLWCRNLAMGTSYFNKRHQGGALEGTADGVIELSARTKSLTEAATVSMMTDAVKSAFSDQSVERVQESYRLAAGTAIDPDKEVEDLRKQGVLTVDSGNTAKDLLAMRIDSLPATDKVNSKARWANVLALMAQSEDNGERAMRLNEAAGAYLLPAKL